MVQTRWKRLALGSTMAMFWGISVAGGYQDENYTRMFMAFLTAIFASGMMRSWWAVLLVPVANAIGIVIDETILHQGITLTRSIGALAVLYTTYGSILTMTILHIRYHRREPT